MLYNYDNKHVGHSLVAGGRLVPLWVPPRGIEVAPHRRLLPRAFFARSDVLTVSQWRGGAVQNHVHSGVEPRVSEPSITH